MSESSPASPAASREQLSSLERFLTVDPGNLRLFNDCAALALRLEDYEALLRAADTRLRLQPTDLPALAARGRALLAKGDFRGATVELEKVAVARPADPVTQQDLGLCYYCLGEFEWARPALEAALQLGERNPGLLRLLISTWHHLGLLDEAAELAAANPAAAQADAGLAGVYALLYLDLGRVPDASEWAKRALELDPESIDALTVEGTLASARGELDAAAGCYERVLERAPNMGRAWVGLGSVELLRHDLPHALEKMRRGVELMPTHVGSWHMLGWTCLLSNDMDNAEQAFQRALDLNRNFAETHGSLAAIAALRGEATTAQRLMEVAQRLDPTCLSAQFTKAVLAGRGGDNQQAHRIVLRALSRLPIHPGMAAAAGLSGAGTRRH